MKENRTEVGTDKQNNAKIGGTIGLGRIISVVLVSVAIVAICVILGVQSFSKGETTQGALYVVLAVIGVAATVAILILNNLNGKKQ